MYGLEMLLVFFFCCVCVCVCMCSLFLLFCSRMLQVLQIMSMCHVRVYECHFARLVRLVLLAPLVRLVSLPAYFVSSLHNCLVFTCVCREVIIVCLSQALRLRRPPKTHREAATAKRGDQVHKAEVASLHSAWSSFSMVCFNAQGLIARLC